MTTTRSLSGKTLFITGASRGIGLAIAVRAARDGANIVIAAKTAEPNPKLPGTIYSAAAEIEAAGGKALPCIVDIRSEDRSKPQWPRRRRNLWRHRHPGQQRLGDSSHGHAADADEALRPDAPDQHARDVPLQQACLPHLLQKPKIRTF
jgi:NAD(P)-dependent dehydrogenase (short-subunit alcohol dehydrogenase family)